MPLGNFREDSQRYVPQKVCSTTGSQHLLLCRKKRQTEVNLDFLAEMKLILKTIRRQTIIFQTSTIMQLMCQNADPSYNVLQKYNLSVKSLLNDK